MKIAIFIISIVGMFFLQYYLSMKKNKWLGLIIPMLNILASLSAVYAIYAYVGKFEVLGSIFRFFSLNITTVIFLTIYYSCRIKVRKNNINEIDKMNIQDL